MAQGATESPQVVTGSQRLVVLLPTYNDWESLMTLLPRIDGVLGLAGLTARVLVIDDGSDVGPDAAAISNLSFANIDSVEVIELTHNLGNQRAIAVGISYVAENLPCDYLVVMDSDHEDKPEYIPELIETSAKHGGKVVFAARSQRSEGLVFRVCYRLYRMLFRLLTGMPISIGNFSVVPGRAVVRVANLSGLWGHYPSSVMKSRLPFETISSARGHRYAGKSSMRFVSLIIHGFTGFAVHADVVVARIFVTLMALMALIALGAVTTFGFKFFTDILVLGWASQFLGLLLVLFFQAIIMVFVLFFIILVTRNQRTIIPIRDYRDFILSVERIFPRDERAASAAAT